MAVFLNEDRIGMDGQVIGFPHIVTCMGVLLLTRHNLYGAHLFYTSTDASDNTAAQFAVYLRQEDVSAGDMIALYGCCDLKARYNANGDAAPWRAEMSDIAIKIGFRGKAFGFDTGIIDPAQGTYVEYRRDAPKDRCRIFYKRNEKMTFTNAVGNVPNVYWAQAPNTLVPSPYNNETSADIKPTEKNKGELNEVNYALRLNSFNIL